MVFIESINLQCLILDYKIINMKNIVIIAMVFCFASACNSNKKKTEEVKTNTEVGIPNVNGNIPDTTNAIDITTHKKDTIIKK